MELLYNPEVMPEQEIKATFVARQPLVDELVSLIAQQPEGAGVQHVVIIAPRGMGKTTVLLMIKFFIQDGDLGQRWQAVKFPEESYGVYDLADFWIEALNLLASETHDESLRAQAEMLKREYPQSDDLQQAALAALKDWRRIHRKRLVLLVENLDMILTQINDERDNARLRDVLMNDGTLMLIGGATTFFKEARAYEQPLYNFFKLYDLDDLRFSQIQDLLCRRAQVDGVPNFEAALKANASRLRVLEYFTGGNPRLVLMLYRVLTQSEIGEVRRALEKLLDEVTPYYKAKVETLPAQQRKILDHIARVSGKTNEGLTPGEIALAVRLPPNQVSAQLKRLSEIGYVRAADLRGRSVYYTLSEPLYAIWHQMRFGREARQRMWWLVSFLKLWYTVEELGAETERLSTRFREYMRAGRFDQALDVLDHQGYMIEATGDAAHGKRVLEKITDAFRAYELLSSALSAYKGGRIEEALRQLDLALEIEPDDYTICYVHGDTLNSLGRHEEAIASFDRALEIKPDDHEAWNNRGISLVRLDREEEAIASFNRALEINPDDHKAWHNRGIVYLIRFIDHMLQKNFDLAKKHWGEVLNSIKRSEDENWTNVVSEALLAVAEKGHWHFARQLVTEADMEEPLFPLARALDYLLTGDQALIEKLSPEVKGIVEQIIAKLRSLAKG